MTSSVLTAFLLPLVVSTMAVLTSGLYPYGLGAGDESLTNSDDGISAPIWMEYGFLFGCVTYSNIYASINGYVNFLEEYVIYGPQLFPLDDTDKAMIAPFWMDFDTTGAAPNGSEGILYHQVYRRFTPDQYSDTGTALVMQRAIMDIRRTNEEDGFSPDEVAVITWSNMVPYPFVNNIGTFTATFQLVLMSDSSKSRSYMIFLYDELDLDPTYTAAQGYQIPSADMVSAPDIFNMFSSLSTEGTKLDDPDSLGNTGEATIWVFRTSDVTCEETEDTAGYLCRAFYQDSRLDEIDDALAQLPHCPCTWELAGLDARYQRDILTGCADSFALIAPGDWAQRCCYEADTSPGATELYGSLRIIQDFDSGSLLKYNPIYYPERHQQEDIIPKDQCCELSDQCDLFYEVRPLASCANYVAPKTYNDPPTIVGLTVLDVQLMVEATMVITANDPEGDPVTLIADFTIPPESTFVVRGRTATLTWTPQNLNPTETFRFTGTDLQGARAVALVTLVRMCPCSVNQGVCDYEHLLSAYKKTDTFQVTYCDCFPAWEGDFCDTEVNGCLANPCQASIQCTDADAAEHNSTGNAYTCSGCAAGFELLGGKKCTDIDECKRGTDTCITGAACTNTYGSFECACPVGYYTVNNTCLMRPDAPWTTAPEDITTATTTAAPTTAATDWATIDSLYPDRGPLAGGTVITLLGNGLQSPYPVTAVNIGDDYLAKVQFCNDTYLEAITSIGMEIDVNRKLLIRLVFQDQRIISVDDHVTFTYRSNPTIRDINPLLTVLEGGTFLTVSGSSLDSVWKPYLVVTTNIRRFLTAGQNSDFNVTNIQSSEICELVNISSETSLLCPTPPSDIPDDILATTGNSSQGDADSAIVTYDTDLAVVTLYIGFKFDGYKAYTNISNVTDEALAAKGVLEIVVTPYFNVTLEAEHSERTPLHIPGYFVDVIDVSNYVVEVGEGRCQRVEISSRLLICFSPSPNDQGAPSGRDVTHAIKVRPGRRLVYAVGSMTYRSNRQLIIGLSIGGALLVLLAITIIGVVFGLRMRTSRRQDDKMAPLRNPDAEIHLGPLPVTSIW